MTKKEAYADGFDRGYNIASWQELPELGTVIPSFRLPDFIGEIETIQDACAVFEQSCYQAEETDREYSPFEFTASAFNKARNSESLWTAFDEGIAAGISASWTKRSAGYYDEVAA